jgi:predicted DNA binding protein
MDEIFLQLDHRLPFAGLSKYVPDMFIERWCDLELDILEINTGREKTAGRSAAQIERYLRHSGSSVVGSNIHDGFIEFVVKCRCTLENSTISMVEGLNGIPVMPVTYRGGFEYIEILSFGLDCLSDITDKLSEIAEVKVLKRHSGIEKNARPVIAVSVEDIIGGLTDRQLDAFVRASELGYYSIPRRTTVQRMAELSGRPASTFEEHLRKAEIKIFNAIKPYARMSASRRRKGVKR